MASSFQLDADEQLAVDELARFAQAEIAPSVANHLGDIIPKDVAHGILRNLAQFGVGSGWVREEGGGLGLPFRLSGRLYEALARSCPDVAGMCFAHEGAAMKIFGGARPAVREKLLGGLIAGELIGCSAVTEASGGSNVRAMRTRAEDAGSHYRVAGEKMWISNATIADVTLLTAKASDGSYVMLAVDLRETQVERREIKKLGLNGWSLGQLNFVDTLVPKENVIGEINGGLRETMRGFERARCFVSTIALGLAGAALDHSIRYAKDREMTPEALRLHLDDLPMPLPLAEMGLALYADYQRALHYRGAVDFDDLIRLALLALKLDEGLVERLRHQWPYILEDEAQDSSRLQEEILRRLSGPDGNWVRLGDPNQAIYETFTTANPEYLLRFRQEPGVVRRDLPESGRSMPAIIAIANHLIQWSQHLDPQDPLHRALALPEIQPTGLDDPQPNPADQPEKIVLYAKRLEAAEEIRLVGQSIENWLKDEANQQLTVAVLTPRNIRGYEVVDELRRRGIEVVDSLLNSTSATRAAASTAAFSARSTDAWRIALRRRTVCLAQGNSPTVLRPTPARRAWERPHYAPSFRQRISRRPGRAGEM